MSQQQKKTLKKQTQREYLDEITQLHKIWKSKKKRLKWWKMETGYHGNIRKLCKIPLPHPDSNISIGCIYLLHLDYVAKATSCNPARLKISKYRTEVFNALKLNVEKYTVPTSEKGFFPWSLS